MNILRIPTIFVVIFLMLHPSCTMRIKLSLNNPQAKIHTPSQRKQLQDIKLMIDGNGQYIYPQEHNFIIPSFNGGVHIVQAISNKYMFPVLVIDQRVQGAPKMKWLHPIDRKLLKVVQEPIMVPLDRIKYFEPDTGFNVLAFLTGGNGIFIMMGLMMFLCYKSLGKLGQAQMAPPAPNQRPN